MSEYIVDGAEPNSTVLKSTTPNGYEHEKWLPVREVIVRCRDCKHYGCEWVSKEVTPYFKACYRLHAIEFMVEPDGFCA